MQVCMCKREGSIYKSVCISALESTNITLRVPDEGTQKI